MTEDLPDRASDRLPAIDLMRGFVMVLMTLDHSGSAFDGGRSMADSARAFRPDTVLEPLQFLARWVTHLCAPTFVMLAGLSLALRVARRRRTPLRGADIDRDILIRGALLVAFDVGWTSWMWRLGHPLQIGVLYAIGMSTIGLIALRRLPAGLVGALGVAVVVGGEAVIALAPPASSLAAATLTGGELGGIYFLYPFVPWSGFMMIGWAIGTRAARAGMRSRDWLGLAAIAAVTFAVVRGLNGYGNAELYRRDGSWLEWLHVSKYPPSWAFAALELGLSFAVLAAMWAWARRGAGAAAWAARWPQRGLLVLGQTALFYFLIHAHLINGVALALGVYKQLGLGATALGWIGLLVVLYPVCRWYLGVKRRHPDSVLRFV